MFMRRRKGDLEVERKAKRRKKDKRRQLAGPASNKN
jgi:hypothetical protein